MTAITNWGVAVVNSLSSALSLVFSFIPKLLGFIVVLIIGLIVASLLAKAVTWLLRRAHFETFSNRIGLTRLEQRMNMRMDVPDVLGKVVYWFVLLIFLVPAVDSLGLTTISLLLGQIITYIPNIFVAILVLFLGTLVATFIADIVRGLLTSANVRSANIYANIARFALIGLSVIIALYQLQIAPAIIETVFMAVVGALALAFGLAFGLGGRDTAQRWLARGEDNLRGISSQISSQRAGQPPMEATPMTEQSRMNQARTAAAMPTDEQIRRRTFSQQPYSGDQPSHP